MNKTKTEAEQSIQDAINYFYHLRVTNPAKKMQAEFHEILKSRLAKVLDGNAQPATKSAIVSFVNRFADDCVDLIAPELEQACEAAQNALLEAKRHAEQALRMQQHLDDLRDDTAYFESLIERYKKEAEALEAEFPDPRARSAYELYKRISEAEPREDAYTKQRCITSAGLVAASYLGLQRYEINPAKQQKQD